MPQILMGPRASESFQLSGSYLTREMSLENEQVKQPRREFVLDHFLKYGAVKNRRVFSLPGAWWSFEKMVEDEWSHAEFVAVEKNYSVACHGAAFMPGTSKMRQFEPLKCGTLSGFATSKAKILWCSAGSFVSFEARDKGNRRKPWLRDWKRWTAAWWDFTSQITEEVLGCLFRTEQHLNLSSGGGIPVSVTVMAAREPKDCGTLIRLIAGDISDPMERRAVFMERWLNRRNEYCDVRVVDYQAYRSAGGAPMLLVNLIFDKRSLAPVEAVVSWK